MSIFHILTRNPTDPIFRTKQTRKFGTRPAHENECWGENDCWSESKFCGENACRVKKEVGVENDSPKWARTFLTSANTAEKTKNVNHVSNLLGVNFLSFQRRLKSETLS